MIGQGQQPLCGGGGRAGQRQQGEAGGLQLLRDQAEAAAAGLRQAPGHGRVIPGGPQPVGEHQGHGQGRQPQDRSEQDIKKPGMARLLASSR
ncbi:hypothetical protein ACFQY5_07120 [Paeniroseomonas aquatica]|uniref:hypothetical protein n=1 Tax=Paeniroseomonas aquatica TaxID=373043 RepID=UPI00361A3681